jgi:pimeloyl-ACP methyl ester carboxylesterase
MGHSEGGIIAPVVASLRSDVDFLVSLAGPGLPGKDILYTQTIDIAVAEGLTRETAEARANRSLGAIERVMAGTDSVAISASLREYFAQNPSELLELTSAEEFELWNTNLNTVWMRTFLALDPREYWSKVTCPVLAINGDRDTQVNAAQNLRAIQFATRRAKNNKVKTTTLTNHNHLFQRSITGALSEYGSLSETLSEETLETVYSWIRNTFAPNGVQPKLNHERN